MDAAYYRRWRREHPEYRLRERERRRRRSRSPQERRRESERRRERARAKDSPPQRVDPLMTWAVELATSLVKPDRRTYLYDALHEECVSEILFAKAQRIDPIEHAKRWLLREKMWRTRNVTGHPLIEPRGAAQSTAS